MNIDQPIGYITIATPGAGKSWLGAQLGRTFERDRYREESGFGGNFEANGRDLEDAITVRQAADVTAWLRAGRTAVISDTNTRPGRDGGPSDLERLCRLVSLAGGTPVIIDLRWEGVEVAIRQDRARGRSGGREVGPEVIERLAKRARRVRIPEGVQSYTREGLIASLRPGFWTPSEEMNSHLEWIHARLWEGTRTFVANFANPVEREVLSGAILHWAAGMGGSPSWWLQMAKVPASVMAARVYGTFPLGEIGRLASVVAEETKRDQFRWLR